MPRAPGSKGRAARRPRAAWPTSPGSTTRARRIGCCRPARRPPPLQARYLSGLYPLAEMGRLLRRQAAHVGMEQAELWVALTDGGSGLEAFCQKNFNRPDLVVILDFYHAADYLKKLAKALHPQDEEQARGKRSSGAGC